MTDLIETLLAKLKLRTNVFHQGQHCGDWEINLEGSNKVLFHFVSTGCCQVEMVDKKRLIDMQQGDLILFPRPGQHVLRSIASSADKHLNDSSDKGVSRLVCAYVEFDTKLHNPIFEALPDYVIARSGSHADPKWLDNLLGLLFAESGSEMTASHTVIERLSDILFIHIIRVYLANCPDKTGILAAYNDNSLRKVLELIHQSPQKPWSIADFSEAAHLSRSAFIEKFSQTLEMPPMTYLTQTRLEYAYTQLSEGDRPILDIALECGYENSSSFSKAFKRVYDINPSAFKKACV